jgi:hypothetical protein
MEPNTKHVLSAIDCAQKPAPQPAEVAGKFLLDSMQHPDRRLMQAAAVTEGAVVGGIKQIPNQIMNHPVETSGKVVLALAAGAAFTAAAAIESPVVAAGLAVGGVGALGLYAWNEGQKLGNDKNLQVALDHIWSTKSIRRAANYLPDMELSLGPEAFDFGLSTAAAGGGNFTAKIISDMPNLATPLMPKLAFAMEDMEAKTPVIDVIGSASKVRDTTTLKMSEHFDHDYDYVGSDYDTGAPSLENLRNSEKLGTFLAKNTDRFFPEIDKTSLGARLDKLESLISKKNWREAYEYANANMSWLDERSADNTISFNEKKVLSAHDAFFKVAMLMQGHPHYKIPADSVARMQNVIAMTRKNFGELDVTWPLKVSSADVGKEDRVLSMPLTQQLNEIESLVNKGFFKDATKIANWSYIGEREKALNSKLTEESDNLLYLLCGRVIRHADSDKATPEAIKAQIKLLRKLSTAN